MGDNLIEIPLTPRQCEVAELYARGYSSRYIAKKLYISDRTVERHMQNIYNKTNIHNRDDLIEALSERIDNGTL